MIGDFFVIFCDFLVGTGEPQPYSNKIRTKSLFYMVVVLVLKSWDWVRSLPPSLGQNPNFYQNFFLKAPLRAVVKNKRSFYGQADRKGSKKV